MKIFFTPLLIIVFCSFSQLNAQVSFVSNGQTLSSNNSWDIRLVDIDGDGVLDAYFEQKVYLNNGLGIFTATDSSFGSSDYVSFADLNGDGYVDVVERDSILLNDSTFHYKFSKKLVSDIEMISSVLTDIDNDGDIDIISCSEATDRLLINDGSGNFTNSGKSLGGWGQATYATGDINGDGFTDIYVAIPHNPPPTFGHTPNKIWFGDGAGNFTSINHDIPGAECRGIIISDFNSDGHPDLFVSDRMSWGRIYFNDWTGNYTDSGHKLGSHTTAVTSADFDKDGDMDLFICQNDGNTNGGVFSVSVPSIVMLNDGTGHFTDSGLRLGASNSMAVAVGDMNNDNRTDAFVVNIKLNSTTYTPEICPVEIWLNDSVTSGIKTTYDEKNVVTICPNPCKGQLNIRSDNTASNNASLTLFDLLGKQVFKKQISNIDNALVDLKGFTKGNYIINIKMINNTINKVISLE
jgi:hypothetical protein